jgi:hypothetical protein
LRPSNSEANLVEPEARLLGGAHRLQAVDGGLFEVPLAAHPRGRRQQAQLLVVADGGHGHTGPRRQLTDRQHRPGIGQLGGDVEPHGIALGHHVEHEERAAVGLLGGHVAQVGFDGGVEPQCEAVLRARRPP